jgi:hypothetical protein
MPARTIRVLDWSRRRALFKETKGSDFVVVKVNQCSILGINEPCRLVAKGNGRLIDHETPAVAKLDDEWSKGLAMSTLA